MNFSHPMNFVHGGQFRHLGHLHPQVIPPLVWKDNVGNVCRISANILYSDHCYSETCRGLIQNTNCSIGYVQPCTGLGGVSWERHFDPLRWNNSMFINKVLKFLFQNPGAFCAVSERRDNRGRKTVSYSFSLTRGVLAKCQIPVNADTLKYIIFMSIKKKAVGNGRHVEIRINSAFSRNPRSLTGYVRDEPFGGILYRIS